MSQAEQREGEGTERIGDLDPSAILVLRAVGNVAARLTTKPTLGDVHGDYQSSFGETPYNSIRSAINRLETAGLVERSNVVVRDGRRTSIELSDRAIQFLTTEFDLEVDDGGQ